MDPISSDFVVPSCLLLSTDIHAQPTGAHGFLSSPLCSWNNRCILQNPQWKLNNCIQYEHRQSCRTILTLSQTHTHTHTNRSSHRWKKERSKKLNLEQNEAKQKRQSSRKKSRPAMVKGKVSDLNLKKALRYLLYLTLLNEFQCCYL